MCEKKTNPSMVGQILDILAKHLLQDISINTFTEMVKELNLNDMNQRLVECIINDAKNKVKQMQLDDEWELFDLLDGGEE